MGGDLVAALSELVGAAEKAPLAPEVVTAMVNVLVAVGQVDAAAVVSRLQTRPTTSSVGRVSDAFITTALAR